MEIINIEKKLFEKTVSGFETFTTEMDNVYNSTQGKNMGEWIDNQDVCFILNISPRTLQTYRDTGKLSFSKINHKVYYKRLDIQKLIENSQNQHTEPNKK